MSMPAFFDSGCQRRGWVRFQWDTQVWIQKVENWVATQTQNSGTRLQVRKSYYSPNEKAKEEAAPDLSSWAGTRLSHKDTGGTLCLSRFASSLSISPGRSLPAHRILLELDQFLSRHHCQVPGCSRPQPQYPCDSHPVAGCNVRRATDSRETDSREDSI